MKKYSILSFFLGLVGACLQPGFLQPSYGASSDFELSSLSEDDSTEISLADILNLPVSIVGIKAVSNREAPAITSVITREEILNTGAQDLQEVLSLLVPGYSFVGFGAHGILAARGVETLNGRVLLMFDGLEITDRTYGILTWGYRYNIDNVDHIEIIRGPGSAIYGGNAELSVINVITRSANLNGAFATFTNAQMSEGFAHRALTAGFGKTLGDFSSSLSLTSSLGNRSQVEFTNPATGGQISTYGNNRLDLMDINFKIAYKTLSFRSYMNNYDNTTYTSWAVPPLGDPYSGRGIMHHSRQSIYELKNTTKLSSAYSVQQKVVFKRDEPVVGDQRFTDDPLYWSAFANYSDTLIASLTNSWDVTQNLNLIGGFESVSNWYYSNVSTVYDVPLKGLADPQIFVTQAFFAQGTLYTPLANITFGGRYDWSSAYKPAFVPRIGLTKAFDRLHVKLIASQGYKTPMAATVDYILPNNPVGPEKATTFETEVGYKFTDNLWASVDIFNTSINNPIVYSVPDDAYINSGRLGSRGVEAQLKARSRMVDFDANYSLYTAAADSTNFAQISALNSSSFLGAPQRMANLIATFKPIKNLTIIPFLQYLGERYTETGELGATATFNFNIRYKDLLVPGLNISAGVRDLFDRGTIYPTTDAGNTPITYGASRSLITNLTYSIPL